MAAHGTVSTCVLVASYDEEKSTETSCDVPFIVNGCRTWLILIGQRLT